MAIDDPRRLVEEFVAAVIGPLVGGFIVQFAAEGFREFGLRHMLIFALMVILIVRFFRQGLWGLVRRVWTHFSGERAGRARHVQEAGE